MCRKNQRRIFNTGCKKLVSCVIRITKRVFTSHTQDFIVFSNSATWNNCQYFILRWKPNKDNNGYLHQTISSILWFSFYQSCCAPFHSFALISYAITITTQRTHIFPWLLFYLWIHKYIRNIFSNSIFQIKYSMLHNGKAIWLII